MARTVYAPTTDPGTDTDAQIARLRVAIGRLDRQLRQQTNTTLTPSQLSVFGSIQAHGPINLGELADRERLSPPTISKITAFLEKHRLIERIRDKNDRRVWYVRTTRRGERWSEQRRAERNAWLADRFQRLAPDEQDALNLAILALEHLLDLD